MTMHHTSDERNDELGHELVKPLRSRRSDDVHRVGLVGEQNGGLLVFGGFRGDHGTALIAELLCSPAVRRRNGRAPRAMNESPLLSPRNAPRC
jgi:hypothetical protein